MATYRALLSLKSSLDDPDSRLSALRLLNLSNNVFNRTFPPELSNLTNLLVLDLYNNNLTGVLPVSRFFASGFNWRFCVSRFSGSNSDLSVAGSYVVADGCAVTIPVGVSSHELSSAAPWKVGYLELSVGVV
ncbi:hypothetical protein ACLB2K_003426 [Fragaria x ananassa]